MCDLQSAGRDVKKVVIHGSPHALIIHQFGTSAQNIDVKIFKNSKLLYLYFDYYDRINIGKHLLAKGNKNVACW